VRAQLEETLQALGCDSFDLFQLHAVTSVEELGERQHAAEELLRARDEGLCRFVGITGHDLGAPAAHAEALRRYDFDTVMFPVFPRVFGNDEYRRDAEALLELCEERDAGVMAIKAAAARPWGGRPVEERETTTWYEAYRTREEIARGIRFALSTEGVDAFCTPSDIGLLATAIDVANGFSPMSEGERRDAIAEVTDESLIFPMAQEA
jgi:predicted aldo/keto reductase-like oxidoreductase